MKYFHPVENISSYLYMHHMCFGCMISMYKKHKLMKGQFSHDFHYQILRWKFCEVDTHNLFHNINVMIWFTYEKTKHFEKSIYLLILNFLHLLKPIYEFFKFIDKILSNSFISIEIVHVKILIQFSI